MSNTITRGCYPASESRDNHPVFAVACAVTAAAHLSPLVDWADLDGNLLISNDLYDGLTIVDGKVTLPSGPGLEIIQRKI